MTDSFKKHIRRSALAGIALSFVIGAGAAELTDTISLPAGTVEGRLPNGLHYLLLPNDYPEGRAEFRLVWQVGSVQQNDRQGGAAHFLEHMAFGGSKNFPDRGAVGYLESLGMRYGIDINAFTGHDRTIYLFATPVSDSLKASGFAKPLSIIRDWTSELTINPERVETEKGIILEELRSTVQDDPFYDLKIGQSRFASRMPLGTPEEVRKMTSKTLENYYRKWYRPELGAIVVVGDIDPASVEAEIKRQFSSLKRGDTGDFTHYNLEYKPGRQIMVDLDSLTTNDQVEMIIPHPGLTVRTIDDARTKEIGRIAVNTLSKRFSDLGLRCDVSDSWYLGNTNHLVFNATANKNMPLDSCVAKVSNIIHSALRNGFYDNEIQYQVDRRALNLKYLAARENSSTGWCDDFADYIISGERYISDPEQVLTLIDAVKTITPEEVRALLSQWMVNYENNFLIAAHTSPRKADDFQLDDIVAWWDKGLELAPIPYEFVEPVEKVQEHVPTPDILAKRHDFDPSTISEPVYYKGLDLYEYRLSNGITLLLKPTKDDGSPLFGLVSPGGYSSLSPEKLALLGGTASYIDMGGIAKADNIGDYLYQSGIALNTTLENNWHGFLGAFDISSYNEFFNFVYEKITDPQLLYDEFESIRQSMLEDDGEESVLSRMLSRDHERQVVMRMDKLMGNTLPEAKAEGSNADRKKARIDLINKMSLDSMAAFYKELYGRTDSSVYIICGNFRPDFMARSFASVFGRMPASDAPHYNGTAKLELPTDTLLERFPNDNPTQTAFDYLFFGKYRPGLRNSLVLKIMSNLLRNHTITELRERRALVYSPYVMLQYEGRPRGYFYFDINSSADNDNMPQVHEAMMHVLDDLRTNPVSESELENIKQSCIVARREALNPQATSMWRQTITGLLKNGESLEDFENYDDIIRSITPEEMLQAFRSLINPELFVMLYMSDKPVKLK